MESHQPNDYFRTLSPISFGKSFSTPHQVPSRTCRPSCFLMTISSGISSTWAELGLLQLQTSCSAAIRSTPTIIFRIWYSVSHGGANSNPGSRIGSKGWNHMLLNGILNFAVERNLKRILVPTAELVVSMTDPKRRQTLNRELFDRIYDHHVCAYFRAERAGLWWVVDEPQHRDRLVEPVKDQVGSPAKSKTICIYHDVERGIGHAGIDPQLEAYANANASQALEDMLSVERRVGIRATYSAVGLFLPDVRASIAKDGHCIAFHTFDHRIGAGFAHRFGQFLESRALGGRRRYARVMQGNALASACSPARGSITTRSTPTDRLPRQRISPLPVRAHA